MANNRIKVENSRCINCKYCEHREFDQYYCVAKSKRGQRLNNIGHDYLREANGRDFPYFCPLPQHRMIIEEDIRNKREKTQMKRVDEFAKALVFALVDADIANAKWEPTMLNGKKYRLEFTTLKEAE